MPMYGFRCTTCGRAADEFAAMEKSVSIGESISCPTCQNDTYTRQADLAHTDLKEFATPIEMYSVACNSWEEIREIQTKCPDADISDDPADEMFGVPIARTRKAKKQILAATHFEEKS